MIHQTSNGLLGFSPLADGLPSLPTSFTNTKTSFIHRVILARLTAWKGRVQ